MFKIQTADVRGVNKPKKKILKVYAKYKNNTEKRLNLTEKLQKVTECSIIHCTEGF